MTSIYKWTATVILELFCATVLYFLFLYFGTGEQVGTGGFEPYHSIIPYPSSQAREVAEATVMFVAFLFMNFYVTPRIRRREALLLNIVWVVLTLAAIGVVFGSLEVAFVGLIYFLSYALLKEAAGYLWTKSKTIHQTYSFFAPGVFSSFCRAVCNIAGLRGSERWWRPR